MPRRLKVFFHDNCFDGASSAAVFSTFYRDIVDGRCEVAYQGVQHRRGDPFEGLAIDGDDNACVDFRYCDSDRMTWWFDHHVTAFQPPYTRAHFEADESGQKFFDPTARSCTKFQVEVLQREFGWRMPEGFHELIHWADIIDGAQFESAEQPVELAEPALRLMTWLEHNDDPALAHRYIAALGKRPLSQLAREPWITGPLTRILREHERNIERIRTLSLDENGVVYFDLIDQGVRGHNKFIAYCLFPDSRYTVSLTHLGAQIKISVGSNPWSPHPRTHHIASICERYGGGGHPVVGGISLPGDQVARAREIAEEIRRELMIEPRR